jgi:ribose-phosphate pyrophosphokinase
MHDLKLFSGNANRDLSKQIANYLGVPLGRTSRSGEFPDGEICLQDRRGRAWDAMCFSFSQPVRRSTTT